MQLDTIQKLRRINTSLLKIIYEGCQNRQWMCHSFNWFRTKYTYRRRRKKEGIHTLFVAGRKRLTGLLNLCMCFVSSVFSPSCIKLGRETNGVRMGKWEQFVGRRKFRYVVSVVYSAIRHRTLRHRRRSSSKASQYINCAFLCPTTLAGFQESPAGGGRKGFGLVRSVGRLADVPV